MDIEFEKLLIPLSHNLRLYLVHCVLGPLISSLWSAFLFQTLLHKIHCFAMLNLTTELCMTLVFKKQALTDSHDTTFKNVS